MTAPLISVPSARHAAVVSWFGHQSGKRSSRRARRSFAQEGQRNDSGDRVKPNDDHSDSEALWSALLELMPNGVMVLSQLLEIVYQNRRAEDLCEQLQKSEQSDQPLPSIIVELCQRLIQENVTSADPLILEFQNNEEQFLRLQAQWIAVASEPQPLLLVLLEDCYATLRKELVLEQQKYDLTDREAEIWFLLRQKYSYQEISSLLQISLNTVKTHVKNVYAKRKGLDGEQKIWYSR